MIKKSREFPASLAAPHKDGGGALALAADVGGGAMGAALDAGGGGLRAVAELEALDAEADVIEMGPALTVREREAAKVIGRAGKLAAWRELARGYLANAKLKPEAECLVEAFCEHYALWKEAGEIIREQGLMISTAMGRAKQKHPCLSIMESEADLVMKIAGKLGIEWLDGADTENSTLEDLLK